MSKVAAAVNYRTETLIMDGCTVVLHRPELSAEVRTKREGELSKALARYALHLADQAIHKEVAKS
ncbi:MAG: hypothetical protein J6B99_09785 [Oscillospiraceae bacterium]|nr:hypothetical protein [Oscillospiraceae bacterium]